MAYIYEKEYTRAELLSRVGDMSQIASMVPVELSNGSERGVRCLLCKTGSGLEYSIVLDRGMDIYNARFNSVS